MKALVEPGDLMDDAQRDRVAELRGLLSVDDVACAERAVARILAEPDRHVARALADGMAVEAGRLVLARRTLARVPHEVRARVAFVLAATAGALEEADELFFGAWQGERALPSANAALPDARALPKLRRLTLVERERVSSRDVASFESLEELVVEDCGDVDLGELPPRLRRLRISQCPRVVAPAAPLAHLDAVDLGGSGIVPTRLARSVRALTLGGATAAQVDAIASIGELESVDVAGTSFRSLGRAPWPASLREASIAGDSLADLEALRGAAALETLTLRASRIATLPAMPNLGELDASGCRDLQDVSVLEACHFLHTLDLSGCTSFARADQLARLRHLEHLDLSGTAVTDVLPLAALASLRSLRVPARAAEQAPLLRAALPRCDVRS